MMDIRMRVNNIGRSVSAKITNFAALRKGGRGVTNCHWSRICTYYK